jgi:hypothetical protein
MLPVFSKVAVFAAVVLALVAAPAPATAAVAAYRVDLWAHYMGGTVDRYDDNITSALVSDLAGVFGTSESAISIKDRVILPGTSQNLSAVFTVDGGDDAAFLASPREAQATWASSFNLLVYFYSMSVVDGRQAAAATDFSNAYITKVERLGSSDVLPKTRYLELTLHGKHLATATADPNWRYALGTDLANAFELSFSIATHVGLTASASSGVNNSTLSVRFFIKPVLNVAINQTLLTAFFASNGTADWLPNCLNVHTMAAAQDLGIVLIPLRRAGNALDAVPESESELTVTGTGYAPGDESYTEAPTDAPTNAPGSVTNAPGDAAPGVTTAAVFIAATALLSAMSLF